MKARDLEFVERTLSQPGGYSGLYLDPNCQRCGRAAPAWPGLQGFALRVQLLFSAGHHHVLVLKRDGSTLYCGFEATIPYNAEKASHARGNGGPGTSVHNLDNWKLMGKRDQGMDLDCQDCEVIISHAAPRGYRCGNNVMCSHCYDKRVDTDNAPPARV